jgi:hypothetical protein
MSSVGRLVRIDLGEVWTHEARDFSPAEEWPEIQDETIDAMVRLEAVLRPLIAHYG